MRVEHLLKNLAPPALYALAGWALACPLSGQAAVANVSVGDDFFNPSTSTINVNDQVKWTWIGSISHSSTSNAGLWDSGVHGNGFTYSRTFTTAGNFPYHCTIHSFQTGSVTVQAANVPPSVAITSPTNEATFAAPWTGKIQATVSDPDDTVSKVDFFAGTNRLGTVTNPPAGPSLTVLTVSNLAAGNYTLKAVATDSRGASTTVSNVLIKVVTPVPIVLSSLKRVSASAFQFDYSADQGLSYVVLRSGTLPGLTAINTNTATTNTVNFLDNSATGAVNFYRVHLLPNP
jgi:plastocyanin